jgi:ABC-type amino acid transport substrate-binding protein
MRCTLALAAALSLVALLGIAAPAAAQVQPDQAAKIRKAAPEKARVAPKKPRTVLIWNTPPAFMDKDPHKGYCIPFGECAMKNLGEKTGAFKPVISGDLAMYLPEKIKQFDAIVMNNSSGCSSRWTRRRRT